MFFVFVIIHTESEKIKIDIELERRQQLQIQYFIQDVKSDPEKYREIIELNKKNNGLTKKIISS